jgi:uncharacterized protein (TIGR03437 family)
LRGHVPPHALPENDQGEVDPSLSLTSLTVVLQPSDAQQADLEQFLHDQQDPASADYHRWLTPEQYADRFGASVADTQKISAWLEQHNLKVTSVARGRNAITFSGAAADVESAFATRLHRYDVNGQLHFANSTDPTIPTVFSGVVLAVRGLHDFRMPPKRFRVQPLYNSSSGKHYISPDDLATIYNIQPLYAAGYDGTGQKIVVAGQTQIDVTDIQSFRSRFGLPAFDPQTILVPNLKDPGTSTDDLPEADLDIEWSGATARGATIIYVYSFDVMDAVQYAIDQNLAPVLSVSYGLCEPLTSLSDMRTMQSWARQANTQGMTWMNASGDSGGADCYAGSTKVSTLSVDAPASIPEVTGLGGTEFDESGGTYWNSSNGPTGASVMSYIPEKVWNDSTTNNPSSGGGGASMVFTKPAWQAGAGVPNDNARDVPDVSLTASASHDGYLLYSSGQLQAVGGTSVSAPVFAGMAGILNHYLVSNQVQAAAGLGNMNPRLYALAQTSPDAFHDIVNGNNTVSITCTARQRNCTSGDYGYSAGAGYDLASGLGSVDALRLVSAWSGGSGALMRASSTTAVGLNADAITPDDSVIVTATVKSSNGVTPQGNVTFLQGTATLGTAALAGSGGKATATLTVSGSQLGLGEGAITAKFDGDATIAGSTASVNVSVVTSSGGTPSLTALENAASYRQQFAPGMLMAVFGSQLSPVALSAPIIPLPSRMGEVTATVNGVTAPLLYVSTGQLNIQVPYETPVNTTATLVVTANGRSTSRTFAVVPAAPGIFADTNGAPVPNTTAKRGQIVTLFITGGGNNSPAVATGATPSADTPVANLPKPALSVALTVGVQAATIQFIGTPSGLVGVTQINYQVPSGVALGTQPVVVTVNGVASQQASLKVTN